MYQPGHADDAGPRLFLRRAGGPQERSGHHDPELRLHGLDYRHLVPVRLLALLQRRLARHHRQSRQCLPARHQPVDSVRAEQHGSGHGLHRLPDDVRHHHAGADLRRLHQSRDLQGLLPVSHRMADAGVLPLRSHGLGRRHLATLGSGRFRRRHRGAQHRGHGGAGFRFFTSASGA